jgi:hypothetical protein
VEGGKYRYCNNKKYDYTYDATYNYTSIGCAFHQEVGLYKLNSVYPVGALHVESS